VGIGGEGGLSLAPPPLSSYTPAEHIQNFVLVSLEKLRGILPAGALDEGKRTQSYS
jgi:hypothetical protein